MQRVNIYTDVQERGRTLTRKEEGMRKRSQILNYMLLRGLFTKWKYTNVEWCTL